MLRQKVLQLYRQILRVGQTWEAQDPLKTFEERKYIKEEARQKFRENKHLSDQAEIEKLLEEGKERLAIAQHYRVPYERQDQIQVTMSTSKIDNTRFDKEMLNRFHSVVVKPSIEEVRRLLRYYYAGSPLILQMDLKPMLELNAEELNQLLGAPFFADFQGRTSVISRLMDKLIEMFTKNAPDVELDVFYESKANSMIISDKTHRYFIGRTVEEDIFLQESSMTLQQGTTGLSSWIACYFLANYLIAFEDLAGQRVVELGAGCGLAGIVALKCHQVESLISTDFDPNVLNQLTENFRFNFDQKDKRGRVEFCDWNDQESVRMLNANADLVIASDVIYDPDLLAPLVSTLEAFTDENPNCRILIAGQERNPETLNSFLKIVESSKLRIHSKSDSFVKEDVTFISRSITNQGDSVEEQLDIWIAPPQHLENIKLFELRSKHIK